MATYPTGTYAPASKSNGQVIQPSFFNDPEGEIVAIEDGLRTGLQHALTISTGGLTVSTGSVNIAGPSSFASVQVNGASTFVGAVTLSGGLSIAQIVLLTHSTNQGVPSGGSFTTLNWDTETTDPAGMHSTSANSSRITFAGSTGLYRVGLSVTWAQASSGAHIIRIRKNDTAGVAQSLAYFPSVGTIDDHLSALIRIASTGDYITAQVYQESGSTQSITPTTSAELSFWAHLVSQ